MRNEDFAIHVRRRRFVSKIICEGVVGGSCNGNQFIYFFILFSLLDGYGGAGSYYRIDRAIASSIRRGLSLRFSRNGLTLGY